MEYIGAEVSHKIRSAIKAKLMELGAYVDEELPDYIMVMVANKRAKAQMDGDLQLFLGSNTSQFTSWLYQVLQKLQEVTVGTLDKKSSKISSTVMKDSSLTKRKSTGNDNDSHRKEKRRKSSDNRKSKKVEVDVVKDSRKDSESGFKSSSKLLDTDKYSQSHSTKEFVSSTRSENSDSVVSSSADSKTNRKLLLKEKTDKSQDSANLKKNSIESTLPNGSSKSEEKSYLSRLRAEALRSRDERLAALKVPGESDDTRSLISSKDGNETKTGGGKSIYSQNTSRNKIVLMNSDDEDDDEDFINIKADAEAEQLLKEELPRELLEPNLSTPEVSESPAVAEPEESQKENQEGLAPPPDQPTIPLKENLVPKRPAGKETPPVEPSPQPPPAPETLLPVPLNMPAVPPSNRLLRKRIADSEAEATEPKIAKEEEKPASSALSIKDRLGVKKSSALSIVKEAKAIPRLIARSVPSEQRANTTQVESNEVSELVSMRAAPGNSLLSRVVMMRDHPRTERRERVFEGRGVKRGEQDKVEEEEEEYDPSNPAVGTVASIVRVKPRPKVPAALQANKNLILKAVAEAQKSVANAPIRTEPTRLGGLWKRTSVGFVRKVETNVAVTLPNRHLQTYKEQDEDMDKVDIKPDSTRLVSGGNGNNKIIIKVSSTKPEKVQEDVQATNEGTSEDENSASFIRYQEEAVTSEDADTVSSGRSVYPPVGLASRMPRESPQFLVTLDGLDPNMFGSRTTSLDEQPTNKEDYDSENAEPSTPTDNDTPKKTKIPIVYKVESTDDTSELSTLPKSLERCKYWPSCRLGTKCNFHHPTSPCKTFPKCPFGDKCLYIHPFCKFNSACTRKDCPFVHAAPRPFISPVPRPSLVPKTTFAPICRFFPKCSNASCKYLHPKTCRYGKFCSKQDCNFIHQDLPSVDKLKWTSPFKT